MFHKVLYNFVIITWFPQFNCLNVAYRSERAWLLISSLVPHGPLIPSVALYPPRSYANDKTGATEKISPLH